MTIALLISTYNWPEALQRVLESVLLQTRKPDEILIADDGSSESTKQVIDAFRLKTNIPVKHAWQEDNGFQKTKILNKALALCESEYIVQIDGDIIMSPQFIADHINISKPHHVITGSRASLTKEFTLEFLKSKKPIDYNLLRKNSPYKMNAARIPFLTPIFATRYKTKGKHKFYSKGCNMAFWMSSLVKVNGFNEDMYEWGHEDSELVVRLLKIGEKKLFMKFSGVTYHLWHKVSSMERKSINQTILENTVASGDFKIKNGLDKYLNK